jgi:hypothetical protein
MFRYGAQDISNEIRLLEPEEFAQFIWQYSRHKFSLFQTTNCTKRGKVCYSVWSRKNENNSAREKEFLDFTKRVYRNVRATGNAGHVHA